MTELKSWKLVSIFYLTEICHMSVIDKYLRNIACRFYGDRQILLTNHITDISSTQLDLPKG